MAGDFTPDYFVRLFAWLCLENRSRALHQHLRPHYFELPLFQTLSQMIPQHWQTYNRAPTAVEIANEIQRQPVAFTYEEGQYLAQLCALIQQGKFPEMDYIRNSFGSFVQNRELLALNAQESTQALIDSGDWGSYITLLESMRPTFTASFTQTEDLFNVNLIQDLFRTDNIFTGIQIIDHRLGGIFPKELLLFMGDTNVGKSLILHYMAGQILRQGKKVLLVTAEMSKARCMQRLWATLTEAVDDLVYADFQSFSRPMLVVPYLHRLRERYAPLLFVHEVPANTATTDDILQLTERYEPQVVIVDYIDLLAPSMKKDTRRFELSEITTSLRAIGTQCNVSVVSVTQANRQAAGKRHMDNKAVSEDYDKIRIADNVIGIGQNDEDQKRHQLLLTLTKARYAEKGFMERYAIDFHHMRLRFLQAEIYHTQPEAV